VALAQDFDRVIATDVSAGQLGAAERHQRVLYVRARAEAAPIRSRSIALVTVAQALHWIDLDAFWAEVRRVLAPAGVAAVWCYNLSRISAPIDAIVERYYRETVGPFWTPERALLESGYRDVPFPFEEISIAPPAMTIHLTLHDFLGFVGTWSATERYREAHSEDPLPALAADLGRWWKPGDARAVEWPLSLRVGLCR
jgi:SAM-dependent methyltransferase